MGAVKHCRLWRRSRTSPFLTTTLMMPRKKKVLVFGESAGGSNTFLLTTLPNAPSLMNAAAWESGAGPQLATSAVANTLAQKYAATLNCSTSDVRICYFYTC
jgi:hypothetical protein